jgi:hypothetical protein
MSSMSNLSNNHLRKSLLSSDFAVGCKIPPNPIPCIVVRINGVSVVDINDLMIDGENRAICECVVLFGCKLKQRFM